MLSQNLSGPKDEIPKFVRAKIYHPKTDQPQKMLSQNLSGPKNVIPKTDQLWLIVKFDYFRDPPPIMARFFLLPGNLLSIINR